MDEKDLHHTDKKANEERYFKATGLITAVSDLLVAATEARTNAVGASLDDETLHTLASTIYSESLVAESLFVQEQEVAHQAKQDLSIIYDTYPQLCMPLSKLSVEQLNDAKNTLLHKISTLDSNSISSHSDTNEKAQSGLHMVIESINTELSLR
jgi:hypothetical protein